MKKIVTVFFLAFFPFFVFAQTRIAEKKLGKQLESNKDETAVFISELDLSRIYISERGIILIPAMEKSKIKVVSDLDMTGITERIAYANKKLLTTFEVRDLSTKTYAITKIEGIESVAQYKRRCVEEQNSIAYRDITKKPVQVVVQEEANLSGAETTWLPGQIQDKLKSNLQEYLGMKIVVDEKSEKALKKLQVESENSARDEDSAIELGKITTAKFALFTKIRKTGKGYTLSGDFTDLTTGEHLASTASKEYSKPEYLYGPTGAVDELTLNIGTKLGIEISELNRILLTKGTASFSLDEQIALAKQNEDQFKKMMKDYDAELAKLMRSNDINAIQNRKKIEAEKALLEEKQKAERKRQEELRAQKIRAEADERLEEERSTALKKHRDQMAKDAFSKAEEIRRLKLEKQGILGKISVLEAKKKAVVDIRESVEARSVELYEQMEKDKEKEIERIRNKTYSTVELNGEGKPTEQAKIRREKQIIKCDEELTNKFFADVGAVKASVLPQEKSLLTEITLDQKALATTKTISSMGNELKVNFGTYEGGKNGWNAYLSLVSDGILLYADNFIVNYEALSGKKAPDVEYELDDAVIEEYTSNVDMYNSLLARGDPIIYFEIDYNVITETDGMHTFYRFNFNRIRVINTISGKTTQSTNLVNDKNRSFRSEWNLKETEGIVAIEKTKSKILKKNIDKGMDYNSAKIAVANDPEFSKVYTLKMISLVDIPGKNYRMNNSEVTQKLYASVMGKNPSKFKDDSKPVENISWYDAIYFLNRLSARCGLKPVYSVNGTTDVSKWKYTPHSGTSIRGTLKQDTTANGFRLPSNEEWEFAAQGGEKYAYSGSKYLDEVGWYTENSGNRTHPVAQMKSNGYGLYDMNGNVWEWVWNSNGDYRYYRGGSYCSYDSFCDNGSKDYDTPNNRSEDLGFRFVCSSLK